MKPLLEQLHQNKTEAAYSEYLRLLKIQDRILDYRFEPMRLVLRHAVPGKAKGMTYTPDFLVVHKDYFEFHEVKGFWREDARVKIKMAAELFPWFRFLAVSRGTRGVAEWEIEEF
jgi:hypothetical protein